MSNDNDELEAKSNEELRELAAQKGIDVGSHDNKADLIAALRGEPRSGRRGGASGDGGAAEVAENLHREQRQGYSGTVPDETPNSAYTLQGQGHGDTPEEDEGIAHQPS